MVTKEEVLKIANLSKIFVDEKDLDKITEEMSNIIAFADQINDVLESDIDIPDIDESFNVFREDEVKESFDRDLILKNVDGGEDGFFFIKKHSN